MLCYPLIPRQFRVPRPPLVPGNSGGTKTADGEQQMRSAGAQLPSDLVAMRFRRCLDPRQLTGRESCPSDLGSADGLFE